MPKNGVNVNDDTIYDLITRAHAARQTVIEHMEQNSPSTFVLHGGVMEEKQSAETRRLFREVEAATSAAIDRFHRLLMETNDTALLSYPDGPALIAARERGKR